MVYWKIISSASLLTIISILIVTFPTSALLPTFTFVLFATFALILILELLRPLSVLLLVPGWTMPTQFSPAFLRAIFIAFSAFKIPWREIVTNSTTNSTSALIHWLPIRQRIDYKLATIVLSITPALNTCHLCYTHTTNTSASLRLLQSSLPTSCQDCSRLSWFSACWPLYLELPPSSS